MRRLLTKWVLWLCPAGVLLLQGCIFQDPDVGLRAGLTFGSDLAIFLLENATAGLGM
jgi:multisubunit Na+/H+ antiporter MnhB subunit